MDKRRSLAMFKGKQPVFVILAILAGLVLTACGDNTASPAASTTAAVSATTASGAATTAASGAATTAAASGSTGAAASTNPADYGLKAGKPYNGTNLNFLICCNTATQF